jgi:hypothetical protein
MTRVLHPHRLGVHLVVAGFVVAVAVGAAMSTGIQAQGVAAPPELSPDGYYTLEQATRGAFQFNRHCAYCHAAAPGPMSSDATKSLRGFVVGGGRVVMSLGGNYLRSKRYAGRRFYPSVYYVFNRLESMPANNVNSIGISARTDIVAFMLKANGFPAGPRELPPNPKAMKAMSLDEPGFTPLFNGRDFTGMEFFLGPNCVPQPEGCGQSNPALIY